MNGHVRTTDITSFTEHRKRLREHLDQVRASGRPLFVTANGAPAGVLLSPDAYDELVDRAELMMSLSMLHKSREDMREGRSRPASDEIRAIAEELGLQLDR